MSDDKLGTRMFIKSSIEILETMIERAKYKMLCLRKQCSTMGHVPVSENDRTCKYCLTKMD